MPETVAARADVIEDLAEATAELVGQIVPDCEGACLGTSAILAYVLRGHGVEATAVCGAYDEYPHWWLETGELRIDATRGQFLDGRDLVESLIPSADESPYLPERTFPAQWDREQAVAEFARMFEYGDIGEQHGRRILAELERVAAEAGRVWLADHDTTNG